MVRTDRRLTTLTGTGTTRDTDTTRPRQPPRGTHRRRTTMPSRGTTLRRLLDLPTRVTSPSTTARTAAVCNLRRASRRRRVGTPARIASARAQQRPPSTIRLTIPTRRRIIATLIMYKVPGPTRGRTRSPKSNKHSPSLMTRPSCRATVYCRHIGCRTFRRCCHTVLILAQRIRALSRPNVCCPTAF